MNVKQIPLHKLTPKDISGTPEDFEKRYDKRRELGHSTAPAPKLKPIENPNMADLLSRVNLGE